MSRRTLDPARLSSLSLTGLSPSLAGFPNTILLGLIVLPAVRTPPCSHDGLASSAFARRYLRNRCFFLFLALLRCFSSGGSPHVPMYSVHVDRVLLCRVSPFGNPRIKAHLRLPVAYRSLSRPSSALSAKAFPLRPLQLDQL